MKNLELFQAAESRRDVGMARAATRANRAELAWTDTALEFLRQYAETHTIFMAEDMRTASLEQKAVAVPPDGRAWGAVLRRSATAGVIRNGGYAPAKSSNLSPKVLWYSLVYRGSNG